MFGRLAARRSKALQVACSAGKNSNNNNKKLVGTDIHERAISTLRNSQELDWRQFTEKLGGTLVVSDEEHRAVVQQAAKENNLSFGFSAGGMLFPYYCGVASSLADGGLLVEGKYFF